jgi:diaminopimelate decarboxylase
MPFDYVKNEFCRTGKKDIPLQAIAEKIQAPFYFYDVDEVLERANWFKKYSRAQAHFAMKSNSEIHLLKTLAKAGFGVDVVSFGEVEKALRAEFPADKIIYSGVAKSEAELTKAIELGLEQINIESLSELSRIKTIAARIKKTARVALRLNLAMDVPTHPYIQTSAKRNKFGIPMVQLDEALSALKSETNVELVGLSAHIGSQITDLAAFRALAGALQGLVKRVGDSGFKLKTLDLGGGLGIDYLKDEQDEPRVKEYLELLTKELKGLEHLEWILEPGRILSARPGVLIAKVEYVKQTPDAEFLILNTGTHHLLRPALYGAFHRIQPLKEIAGRPMKNYDVVGLLCESSDCFAKDLQLPEMQEGEWLAIREAGAYGRVMASNYNESPLPPEIVVLNDQLIGV